MKNSKFIPDPNTSYSAGLAYLVFKKDISPKIILILQKAGEKNLLKSGGHFIERRNWKMPMGHFNEQKDKDLIDTAIREFQEETGLEVNRKGISEKQSAILKIRSDRPGHDFHQDQFFILISDKEPVKNPKIKLDEVIESVRQFPLDSLPLDNNPAMVAALANGQRRKLSALILNCYNYLVKSGIKEETLKKALNSLNF
jgi:8-oxo-dGTP pyrophosphatase MutT (NUDIX family)